MASLVVHVKNMQVAVEELKRAKILTDPTLKTQTILSLCKKIEEESSLLFQQLPLQQTPRPSPVKTPPIPVKPTPKKNFIPQPLVRPLQEPAVVEQVLTVPHTFSSVSFRILEKKEKERYIKELGIKKEELEDFVKIEKLKAKKKIKETKTADFTLYKPNQIGALANTFMKHFADDLIKKYPKFFKPLFDTFLKVNMNILSRSYVASILFFSLLAFPFFLLFLSVFWWMVNTVYPLSYFWVLGFSIFFALLTPPALYIYPASLIGDRQKAIKADLPFALVHMSAVAGSGAAPISIFELLAESDEYPELKKEIKKILNYVNLFGYNLSNALRNVAASTPSEELKELLNGMISTIETGGDLKGYLKEKADDALNIYRLDRKKRVEALGTFSEVYTSVLIASPLLLIITLAIINSIGGEIGGVSVRILAYLGVGIALPLLNLGFIFFLKTQSSGF